MPDTLLQVSGLVQGVGFRPFVWHLAGELGLNGWVRNDAAGVTIRVKGVAPAAFLSRLQQDAPPLARVEAVRVLAASATEWPCPDTGFQILHSASGEVLTTIGPDAAVCRDCLREITTPADRRWRYALTTCTHCGPRYTVSRGIPYDRARTSLASFPLCPACHTEYIDPADRRFHAETTCCPDCGPQLQVLDANGQVQTGDPIALTVAALQAGKIVAIKGLGGFHLACNARQETAIQTLRARKHRDAKPLAVMGLNLASLRQIVHLLPADEAMLSSPAAPIVVCPRGALPLPDALAPGLNRLGVMLPTSPLHALLWHELAGRPAWQAGVANWCDTPNEHYWVMTSANPQGEPLVRDNDEALARLHGIADLFLLHNRDIVVRCDDSVRLGAALGGTMLRRARGYVPLPVVLPPTFGPVPSILAVGADLKNTLCVLKDNRATLSQYVGSLDNAATAAFHRETRSHLLDILQARPTLVVQDRHPDFLSSRLGTALAAEWDVPVLAVGHHHAHLAAICAERGLSGPVLGLALDGVGLGEDGTAWGGELLRLDGAEVQRLGHLSPLALPGGDRAAREPWRMAVSALFAAGLQGEVPTWLARSYPTVALGPVLQMLEKALNCPRTSSLGRWFDAAAGLLGVCAHQHYEGQAAMHLEALAESYWAKAGAGALPAGAYGLENGVLDLRPLVPSLLALTGNESDRAQGAALFHATLIDGLAAWVDVFARREGLRQLVVGGGCAMNSVLLAGLRSKLAAMGIQVVTAQAVPPNDSGLALGQAWIAQQHWLAGRLPEMKV